MTRDALDSFVKKDAALARERAASGTTRWTP